MRLVLLGLVLLGSSSVSATPRWHPAGASAREIVMAIAERHHHGNADDALTPDQMSNAGRTIIASCGPTSVWAVAVLRDAGYEARVVTTLTLEPWDNVSNGHTMVSVHEPAGWVLYDVDRHVYFTDRAGRPLSLAEMVDRVPTDDYLVSQIGPADFGDALVRSVNRRLLQVPAVGADGLYWFAVDNEATARRIESYAPNYRAIPSAWWRARFYAVRRS